MRATVVAFSLVAVFLLVASGAWIWDDLKSIERPDMDFIQTVFAIAKAHKEVALGSHTPTSENGNTTLLTRELEDLESDLQVRTKPIVAIVNLSEHGTAPVVPGIPEGMVAQNTKQLLANAGAEPLRLTGPEGNRWILAVSRQLDDGRSILVAIPLRNALRAWLHRAIGIGIAAAVALFAATMLFLVLLRVLIGFRVTLVCYKRASLAAMAASRAKGNFLSQMSHELRTPLNAIIGFSDLILQEAFGPIGHAKYTEYTSDIRASGEHLLDLVNNILDISRIESGNSMIRPGILELDQLIGESVQMTSVLARQRQIALVCSDFPVGIHLHADPAALMRVMINLLSNAIKFAPRSSHVTVSAALGGDGSLEIRVADEGPGIPPAEQRRLFIPFVASDGDATKAAKGTGLGLPIARRLMRLHGGDLHIYSDRGVGTIACLILPPARILDGSPAEIPRAAAQ